MRWLIREPLQCRGAAPALLQVMLFPRLSCYVAGRPPWCREPCLCPPVLPSAARGVGAQGTKAMFPWQSPWVHTRVRTRTQTCLHTHVLWMLDTPSFLRAAHVDLSRWSAWLEVQEQERLGSFPGLGHHVLRSIWCFSLPSHPQVPKSWPPGPLRLREGAWPAPCVLLGWGAPTAPIVSRPSDTTGTGMRPEHMLTTSLHSAALPAAAFSPPAAEGQAAPPPPLITPDLPPPPPILTLDAPPPSIPIVLLKHPHGTFTP